MSKPQKKDPTEKTPERRKARRLPILDTFALFVVVPKKGPHRLPLFDLSEIGLRFDLDLEGESPNTFPVSTGEVIDIRFYLNNSLYLPLTIKVARVEETAGIRRIGGEMKDADPIVKEALTSFITMLQQVASIARIDAGPL